VTTDLVSSPNLEFLSTRHVDLLGNLRASPSAIARPTTPGEDQIKRKFCCGWAPLTCSDDQVIDGGLRGLWVVFGTTRLRVPPQTHPVSVLPARVQCRFDHSHWWSWEPGLSGCLSGCGRGAPFLTEPPPGQKVFMPRSWLQPKSNIRGRERMAKPSTTPFLLSSPLSLHNEPTDPSGQHVRFARR